MESCWSLESPSTSVIQVLILKKLLSSVQQSSHFSQFSSYIYIFFLPPEMTLYPLCFCRHQGFGVLSVVLANHAIKLLSSLFQDLQVEALHKVRRQRERACGTSGLPSPLRHASDALSDAVLQGWESDGPPAVLDVMAQSTSIQRIQRLIDSVPLTNLLLTLLSTSYRKVGTSIELESACS